jgi:hypothetical protein
MNPVVFGINGDDPGHAPPSVCPALIGHRQDTPGTALTVNAC